MPRQKQQELRPLRTTLETLSHIFVDQITAKHIAEVLEPCEQTDDAAEIKKYMEEKDYDVFGVITGGSIYGYVERSELKQGSCKQYEKTFHPSELVSANAPLIDVFLILRDVPRVFVLYGNAVEGIITRADLQRGPVRLMLYALTALLEVHLQRLIYIFHGDGSWEKVARPERTSKAKKRYRVLSLRNESIDLVSCLQFIDKANVLIFSRKMDKVRKRLGLAGRKSSETFFDRAKHLRDNLAHSHDLTIKLSWPDVVDLAVKMIQVIRACEEIEASPKPFMQDRF